MLFSLKCWCQADKRNLMFHSTDALLQYLPIFIFFAIAVAISIVIVILPQLLAVKKPQKDKLSSYECGFDPFIDAREPFYVKFYLIAILFIIFDVEIIYFFPFIFSIMQISYIGLFVMYIFLVILGIGFMYEWKKGSLDWE